MKKDWKNRLLPIILTVTLASSMILPSLTLALGSFDLRSPIIQTPINQYQADLAPGVMEKHYSFEGKEGKKIESFVVEVDMQNPSLSIEAGTPNDETAFGLQPVRGQASAASGDNHTVVAAVNADFYNMATGEPSGYVYKNGQAVKSKSLASQEFFGIKKSGEAVIGTPAEFEGIKDEIQEALGGNAILVKKGQIYETPQTGADKEPRTAVGIKEDGDVFFVVIDGRQEPYSAGISMPDLAQLMIDLGAESALNLDGGGSSTFATRELGGDKLEVDNLPSDRMERSVANSWLIVSKTPADHVFNSAHIEPYDQSFTPGSKIQFSAKGRDKSMASADLPASGLTWELTDGSFGSIDETGKFISNGKTGVLNVLLKHMGQEVGRSIIEVAQPDQMSFIAGEMTAGRKSKLDLGLTTLFQKREVKWNLEDMDFDIPEGMGTIDETGVLHTGDKNITGIIKAALKGTGLSAQIKVSVGKLPEVVFDFEGSMGNWKTSTANRGEKGLLDLSRYPAPVIFGNQSLQIDFDFTNAQTGTTLGVYAGPGTNMAINDNPTAIGMWVYGTPEAQGYWLRMLLVDGNNKSQTLNLTEENSGINWTGWKYIEAEIPASFTGPFKISGTQAIRLMSTKSGITGPMTKGSVYVDNIRAVYGEKVDDLHPPVIQSVNVEEQTYTTNAVVIKAVVNEFEEDPFKTGIDWEKISIFVDGKNYSNFEGHYSYDMDGSVSLSGLKWADGIHKVIIKVPDKFGNQAVKTSYFTVNTGSAKLEVGKRQEAALLGDVFDLTVKALHPDVMFGADMNLRIDKNYRVEKIQFSEGFDGSTSSYDADTGIVSLNLVNSGDAGSAAEAAVISIRIPPSTKEGSKLTYDLTEGSINFHTPKGDDFVPTFSMKPATVEVKGAYEIVSEPVLIGKPAIITVKDNDKNSIGDVEVFAEIDGSKEPVLLGKTDSSGSVKVDSITNEVKKIALYAVKEGKYSFKWNTQTFPPLTRDGEIKNLISTAAGDPYKEKNFTWMSSPLAKGKTLIQAAKKKDYDRKGNSSLETFTGTWSSQVFSGEQNISKNGIARVNEAALKNLQQDTTYIFRVGDGETWSELQEFTTLKRKQSFEFAILGDTQSPADLRDFNSILGELNNKDLSLMIHVGDLIDESAKFTQWDDTLGTMSQYKNIRATDLVANLGNHEYMGDADGHLAKAIFNTPENGPAADIGGTYSVDYNNIHFSVMGFTSDEGVLDEQLEWLEKDVKTSDKPWKILVTHKPPYYTNPFGGNEDMKEKLPPIMDELGIDIVFSGHDHSYGRTKKLKAGKEDPGGTVYIVAGTTGKKHYDAVADEIFDYVNMDNIAVSMQAKVDKDQITFTTITSDGEIIDTFTIKNEDYDRED
ncbi:phosphodiester glycosidase family protein [Peribacillus deserti]|uniref:Metallophosphoesterase n=1 Tax=Peribacillus deserti TaxID=673318 RepID=A0A2N5M461_9BACI|nr:phosphodiester glycosidase family protein [Peribacillus deserti]PLT29154.1 hypothetical protein CUU66_14510 [Peribacillus deserti]